MAGIILNAVILSDYKSGIVAITKINGNGKRDPPQYRLEPAGSEEISSILVDSVTHSSGRKRGCRSVPLTKSDVPPSKPDSVDLF